MTVAATTPYWEETPRPNVTSGCRVCRVTPEEAANGRVVVSPTGKAHHGEYGKTLCGHDATGDNWWWPL